MPLKAILGKPTSKPSLITVISERTFSKINCRVETSKQKIRNEPEVQRRTSVNNEQLSQRHRASSGEISAKDETAHRTYSKTCVSDRILMVDYPRPAICLFTGIALFKIVLPCYILPFSDSAPIYNSRKIG